MKDIQRIGVVGAGTMGRGIVQLFAQAGFDVYCHDSNEGAVDKALQFVSDMLARAVEKGRQSRDEADATLARIHPCDELRELASCDLVIEAIIEDVEAKRSLFDALETVVAQDAILASNTSSLVVSEIAAGCRHPERLAGLHFFNPVPLMKVAEVVAAVRTSAATVEALTRVVSDAGHRAVVASDQPGFLVNHAGRGLYTEGLRLLEEQCASVEQIDTVLREAAGFKMGPFELMDLTGLDVSGKVMTSIYDQFQQEPRFRPSPLIAPRIAAGLFGRKTGEGWYDYRDHPHQNAVPSSQPVLPHPLSVWIDPAATQAEELRILVERSEATLCDRPDLGDLLVVQPWGLDISAYCAEQGLDAARCVGLDPLPELDSHRTLMLSAITATAARDAALALFSRDCPVTCINDSPGFVVQRVVATIVNIGCHIAQLGIASVEDIEAAVKLGLGYPSGPLAMGDETGAARVLEILDNMQRVTGDMRYRPSPWLRRRAQLGQSLLTREAARS